MADSTFRVGGLASGMDTNSIVDQLVALEKRPIDQLRSKQTGIKTQLSKLGDLISRLATLQTAAADLGANGVLAAKLSSSNDAFSAAPGTDAAAGRYTVQVDSLARASKWRSAAFASGANMAGGTLSLTVQGKTYDPITIGDNASLSDVALAIRQSGAPVSAAVLSDGTNSYLSITARDTGFPLTGAAGDALGIAFTPQASPTGQVPGFAETQAAKNAVLWVDGLKFTRQTNTVTDALPGTTLTLKKETGLPEDVVFSTDLDATKARLQKFVDNYNMVMSLVNTSLKPTKDTDRNASLVGDTAVRGLQAKMQSLLVAQVGALANVRTLADLGVKTAKDGSLSVDGSTFEKAVARDPAAVNALFATADTGISATVKSLVDLQTRASDGALTSRQGSLNDTVARMDKQAEVMQRRIDAFRDTLIRQFTAMENTVSSMKGVGTFLAQQDARASAK